MQQFKTTDGREWQIAVNFGTVKRVHGETGVMLTTLFADDKAIAALFGDDMKFCAVVASLVGSQLQAAGVSEDDFFAAVDGTVIETVASLLLEEIADFFPEPRKGLLKKMLATFRAEKARIVAEQCAEAEAKILKMEQWTHTSSDSSSPGSAA